MPAPLLVFATVQFGQLPFAAVAVLLMTGEYSADQIGSTLQVVPRRGVLLTSKALVAAATGFLGGMLAIGLGTIPTALGAGAFGAYTFGELVSTALAAGGYLALLGLMVLGLGLLIRTSAGGIVAMLMLVVGLPQILQLVRIDWVQDAIAFLPSNAAAFLASGSGEPYGLGMVLMVLFAWAAALLGAGAVRFMRNDA